jgi:hypothetical protein
LERGLDFSFDEDHFLLFNEVARLEAVEIDTGW